MAPPAAQSNSLTPRRWLSTLARQSSQAQAAGKMSRALSYFVNRELSRGWVGWHSQWAELVRKRESMRRSLGHLLNRQLSRGFGAWLEMAVERAAFMQKLRTA